MEELILSQSILKLWWEALYAKCMTEELWGERGKTKKTISIVWAKIPLQLMQTYYKKKKKKKDKGEGRTLDAIWINHQS